MRTGCTIGLSAALPALVSGLLAGAPAPERERLGLEAAAAEAAAGTVALPDRFEVLSVRVDEGPGCPAGEGLPPRAEILEANGPNASGIVLLRMCLFAGDAPCCPARASVRGIVRGPALLATRALVRGRAIAPADVETAEADLTRLAERPLREASQLEGWVPLRTLGARRVITAGLLRVAPVVRRGDAVPLKFERSGFTVAALGAVGRDGAPGETVPAVNLATGAAVLARVQPDGSLLVVRGPIPERRP